MKKEYIEKLQEVILNKQPIIVYIDNDDFGIFTYNKEKNIYQGEIGALTLETLTKVLAEKKESDYIRLELIKGV